MADFAKLLTDKMKKATEATRATEPAAGKAAAATSEPLAASPAPLPMADAPPAPEAPPAAKESRRKAKPAPVKSGGSNTNRVTVNLFEADRRALAIIKERLANSGHDFTNRSDSIKIALRLAAKARKEDLAALFLEIRAEDRRFSGNE
jgi:hypothetical protein